MTKPVNFVAFHMAMKDPDPYAEMVRLMAASARKLHPNCRVVLLTDEYTKVPGLHEDATIRGAIDPDKIMFFRMAIQTAYMRSKFFDTHTVLIDTDILVNRSLDGVFAHDFDVGLTWRRELPGQPFNGGVIFLKPGGKAEAFMNEALALYTRLRDPKVNLLKWYGDQIALAKTVDVEDREVERLGRVERHGAKIQFFPCRTHNFTPDRELTKRSEERYLIHFKGQRKDMMKPYAVNHLGLAA